jgi:hypothetical protein
MPGAEPNSPLPKVPTASADNDAERGVFRRADRPVAASLAT